MANKGRLTTGIFCLFLAGLLVWNIALPDRARSETENRTLAQFPDFSWETLKNGSFTEGMEDYFADQFPLRDDWTGLKARCEQLLGKREFNGVYLCGDTLIAKVDEPDRLQAEKNLDDVKRFGEASHGRVLLGLIPSAAEVWKDRLPQGAPRFDQAYPKRGGENGPAHGGSAGSLDGTRGGTHLLPDRPPLDHPWGVLRSQCAVGRLGEGAIKGN